VQAWFASGSYRGHFAKHTLVASFSQAAEYARGPLDVFETDWQRQWLVERGVEIVSEASRHLTDELKARHPEIPWQMVAGIGNVLGHNYESIAAPVMWKLAQADLPALEKVCCEELKAENERERAIKVLRGRDRLRG
jgi:uncharacterized protein with HEPN domain